MCDIIATSMCRQTRCVCQESCLVLRVGRVPYVTLPHSSNVLHAYQLPLPAPCRFPVAHAYPIPHSAEEAGCCGHLLGQGILCPNLRGCSSLMRFSEPYNSSQRFFHDQFSSSNGCIMHLWGHLIGFEF